MKAFRVKISVVMPVYNSAASVQQAIQSVITQQGTSFELLIGDDGSTDESWVKINAYRSAPHVRVFHFRTNQGAARTRNRLIAEAKGKYISLCDADDVMLPRNLSALSKILDVFPRIGVVYGDVLVKTAQGQARIKGRVFPDKSWDILGGCLANGGAMVRRSLIKKVGGYRVELPYLEDCDLFLRLAESTQFYYLTGKPLYQQNVSPGSLSDQSKIKLKEMSQTLLCNAMQRRYGVNVEW